MKSRPVWLKLKRDDKMAALLRCRVEYIVDEYIEQLREYFAIEHPALTKSRSFNSAFQAYLKQLRERAPLWRQGQWAHYPWLSILVHVLDEEQFQAVRTARNRNLITAPEQKKFYDAVIGIAGLSVGNSAALAIALQGGGKRMRLADGDTLALSNLNRVRAGVQSLGLSKTEVTARQIYELNPYAELEVYSGRLIEKNIKKFFMGPPRLDVIVDEIDDLAMKARIRAYAKKLRVPLVSAADVADNGVVFVERYDHDPQPEPFLGFLDKIAPKELKQLNHRQVGEKIARLVGVEHHAERMVQSLQEIGKTIVSWPQLGGAAMLNGAVVAYCVRKIIVEEKLPSGRYFVSLDEKFKS